jgi:hypothetical protein
MFISIEFYIKYNAFCYMFSGCSPSVPLTVVVVGLITATSSLSATDQSKLLNCTNARVDALHGWRRTCLLCRIHTIGCKYERHAGCMKVYICSVMRTRQRFARSNSECWISLYSKPYIETILMNEGLGNAFSRSCSLLSMRLFDVLSSMLIWKFFLHIL